MRQICLLCSLLLAVTPGSGEDLLQQARKTLEEAQVRARSANEAALKGDGDGATRLMAEHTTLLARAREQYEAFHKQDPSSVPGLVEYASILSVMDDVDLAEELLRDAVARDPGNTDAWMALGRSQYAQGPSHAPDALASFRTVLALNPEPRQAAAAHAAAAELLQAAGLSGLAMAECGKALELEPENVDARIVRASLDLSGGRIREASDRVDALGRISRESDSKLVRSLNAAMADFDYCRRLAPDTAEDQMAYAKLLVRLGRLAECVFPLRRVSELQPDNSVAWNMLGSVLQESGDLKGALDAFDKSLSVNPDQARTREAAGALRKKLGETPPAQAPGPAPGN